MKGLHQREDFDYARAVMLKYLELEPDAGVVRRELAHNYMKTSAEPGNSIIQFRYPDDIAAKIIKLLDQAHVAAPDDHETLALLVYTHALQGNVEKGLDALNKANSLEQKGAWLDYNAALLAASDKRYFDALDLLTPIGVEKILPNSPDANRIYNASWELLNKLALIDPKLDTLATVREGLATRVEINKLPEYMLDYDPDGPPVLLHFSSQDKGCGFCIRELPVFHKFAVRNKQNGNRYHLVYLSSEPWKKLLTQRSDILTGIGLTGVPSYFLALDGAYTAKWGSNSPQNLVRMIDNHETFLARSNMYVEIEPRSVYYHDYMLRLYNEYVKDKRDGFKAMAAAIGANDWSYARQYGFQSQAEADEAALTTCQNVSDGKLDQYTCKLFARGNTLVHSAAEKHQKMRAANKQRVTVEAKRAQIKRNADKERAAAEKERSNRATEKAASNGNALVEPSMTDPKTARSLAEAVRQFAELPEHYKALAIAEAGGEFVTGLVSKEITQQRANQKALDSCKELSKDRAIGADCLLHTIGKIEVKDHSDKNIQKITARQQKKNASDSVLSASYKKYKRLSDDKAYAVSINDDDQWVYGMAFGKRGEDEATAAAITECEAERAANNLANECRILILNSKFVELNK